MAEEPKTMRFWQNRAVLITGALGFVGSRLAWDLSKRGARVTAYDRTMDARDDEVRSLLIRHAEAVVGNLDNLRSVDALLAQSSPEFVFHLGAQTVVGAAHQDPVQTFEANVRGTYNLLEACRRNRSSITGVIVASSDKAYGEATGVPLKEDSALLGRGPYDVSKSCTDLLTQSYHHHYGLPTAVLRCSNIYGDGDFNWSRIVPGTIRAFVKREAPVIRSDGSPIREYTYVGDAVDAYRVVAEKFETASLAGHAFNISSEEAVSVLELVRSIQSLMNVREVEPVIQGTAVGEIREQRLSGAKAREILDWAPRVDLRTGLEATISWYQQYIAGPSARGRAAAGECR